MPDLTTPSPRADRTVDSPEVLSVHKTSEGPVAYVRRADGRVAVVDYASIDPWNWRRVSPQPFGQAA